MLDKLLEKFSSFCKNALNRIKETNIRGMQWVGLDGLANMETSALLVIFLMLFCPVIWSMAISIILVVGKSLLDTKKGSSDEKHDLICCIVGVLLGAILGTVHAAVVLL